MEDLYSWTDYEKDRLEEEEMERFRAESDKREFERLKPAPYEVIEKMDVKRLLAYYNRFRKDVSRGDYNSRWGRNPLLTNHLNTIKGFLDSKPHVERPGKPKKEKKGLTKKR
jgi:hypothetical protein